MLALLEALSGGWSAEPGGARDLALLTLFAAVALATTACTLVTRASRQWAVACFAAAGAALALATALRVAGGAAAPAAWGGRLAVPIDYPNAEAAALLVGLWPALLLAARRPAPILLRALALGAASAMLAGWVFAQSKGAGIGLAVSGVVVLAVSPARLRLLPPLVLALAPAAAAYRPLTAAYRADFTAGFDDAFHRGGWAMLAVALAGVVLGAVYAGIDRAVDPGPRARRVLGALAAGAACLLIVGGIAAFLVAEPHPGRFAADRWHAFKHLPTSETTSSHFLSLGSNRYDFWRVALLELDRRPALGIGGAGYQDAYLIRRRSSETPARAHSIELDLLAENGLVGLLLFLAAVLPLLAAAALGTRRRTLSSTAALGAGVASLAHASVDWTWSFPAVVVPVFALLGIAVAGRARETRRARVSMRLGAVAALVVALLVFTPRWVSARLVEAALRGSGSAASDLRWAKRLDPFSTAPYLAEANLAARPAAAIEPLRRAVEKQPRSAALHYELGLAYLRAGMRGQARRELRTALALDPGDFLIARALRRAG